MARIGVFGAMASGKSTVSRWFQEWGAALVDGDALGWVTLHEGAVAAELAAAFGADVLGPAGAVDRAALGRIVFRDARAMARLNEIVQPRLLDRVRADLAKSSAGPVVLDAALLTTWGLDSELDGVVEVRSDERIRAARLQRARGFTEAEALVRIRGQALPAVRNPKRHWVIQNDGDLASLRARCEAVWNEIAALP